MIGATRAFGIGLAFAAVCGCGGADRASREVTAYVSADRPFSEPVMMRNTADDPTWTSFIYHDHVSWFPGGGYVVEKLFREHFAETYLASTSGTFRDIGDRASFFTDISQMKPEGWQPGTVDAIATASADGRRIVIKAVNYSAGANTMLVHLQGSRVPAAATVNLYTVTAGLRDAASLEEPDRIRPVERTLEYSRDLTIDLQPYTVAVIEISTR